ncbi:uncharacterized protein C8Q71DRAFT_818278 [Rhodofomes roseus]|uniref:Uncharacterized protein n=1 Tax=Rhodofomes roseus TaxID=34475 RepID=A0ABQ8JZY7_9APHY|nr:uncharacterized protein C8Q71DRAFT_818278 [Rhodofomes roseus]KAH9829911.1 hypothetical protein C8Q71DRAFT_818278 [Rhodofomes roseus]
MSPSVNSPAPTASQTGNSDATSTQNGQDNHSEYPEQRHAGAVGLGPEFGRGVTTGEKFEGYKEELKGKVLRKPDVVQHGHDLRTGELKRREQAEDDVNPLRGPDEADANVQNGDRPEVPKSDSNKPTAMPPRVGDTSHPTEQGRYEQATSVAPEGSATSAPGEHAYKNIG